MAGDERRRYPRIGRKCVVDLEVMGGNADNIMIGGSTINVSPAGIYLKAPLDCRRGDILKVALNLDGRVVHIQVVVRWTDTTPSGDLGIGAEFILLEDISPEDLIKLIDKSMLEN